MAQTADPTPAISRSVRLSRIFQYENFKFFGNRTNRIHIRGTAIKMDRNNRTRSRRDGPFNLPGIEIGSGRIDIHEHRPRAAVRDCLGGSEKCVRTGDHLIARLNTQRQQAEM